MVIPSGYNTVAAASSGFALLNREFGGVMQNIVITSQTNCAWGIGTFIIAPAYRDNLQVTLTGTRASQSNCVLSVTLLSPFLVNTIDLSFCGLLTSLTIAASGGTKDPGVPYDGAYVAISNVQIFTSATATGDPHLVSASGVGYGFDGEPGNTYSLFSAPLAPVNPWVP